MSTFNEQLQFLVESAFREDIGDGDHTTISCIPPDARGKAVLKVKQDGILAGMEIAEKIFRLKEPSSIFTPFKQDGEVMRDGEDAFEAEASLHTTLLCERLILNCMQRMSGIATYARQMSDLIKDLPVKLLDTRKTTPNFRLFEKMAVKIGGAVNHRMGLYDMIMLKDNHVDYAGGIEAAITGANKYLKETGRKLKIEIETRNLAEVDEVLRVGQVDIIMLDNFSLDNLREAVKRIGGRYETEASGNITEKTLRAVAETGVDGISSGALTHQARSLDLSLKAF